MKEVAEIKRGNDLAKIEYKKFGEDGDVILFLPGVFTSINSFAPK